jgi:hypothetical protein
MRSDPSELYRVTRSATTIAGRIDLRNCMRAICGRRPDRPDRPVRSRVAAILAPEGHPTARPPITERATRQSDSGEGRTPTPPPSCPPRPWPASSRSRTTGSAPRGGLDPLRMGDSPDQAVPGASRAAVDTGEMPSQEELVRWETERSGGLIDRFPIELSPDVCAC